MKFKKKHYGKGGGGGGGGNREFSKRVGVIPYTTKKKIFTRFQEAAVTSIL